jgi:quinol monooxygenase YgiN
MALVGASTDAAAQAIHAVTYVEVMPLSAADGRTLLQRYRDATRSEEGNLRCEVVSRIGQPHHLAVLEVWRDQAAFDAHTRSAGRAQIRAAIDAVRGAPIDDRVHGALSVGALQPGPAGDAVYVLTHVDVIPPRKDDGVTALRELAEASRPGAIRFEVVQQTNRPNHFTVVEVWKDANAVEAHAMAEATCRFRDRLGPMSGALYDERMFRLVP